MARPSDWKNGPTKLQRFPQEFIPQLLQLAHIWDDCKAKGFVQNPIPSIFEQEQIDFLVDEVLANDLKDLSESEVNKFLILLIDRVFPTDKKPH